MKAIGLRGVIKYGKYAVTNDVIGYTGGRAAGKPITYDLNIEVSEAILYAADGEDVVLKEFAGGQLTMGVNELDYTTQADLYGHTRTAASTGVPESLKAKADDSAVPVGVGVVVPVLRENESGVNVTWFRAIFLTKVTFGEPAMSFKTKEKTVTFSTPTTVGTIQRDAAGEWRDESLHATYSAANAWVDDKLDISA